MPDAVGIAAIRHRCGKPPAYTELALGLAQQQQYPAVVGSVTKKLTA
jgi:hypothetical protein